MKLIIGPFLDENENMSVYFSRENKTVLKSQNRRLVILNTIVIRKSEVTYKILFKAHINFLLGNFSFRIVPSLERCLKLSEGILNM